MPLTHKESLLDKIKHIIFGKPKDFQDKSIFHQLSLIPFLAWVGLGADGLSSSAYGPAEAFATLGEHTYLAAFLALFTGFTVVIISSCYSRIIEEFPHGGGGYVVASKLLGNRVGVVSGCALFVDYILTIAVSVAAAGDALFSFIPIEYHHFKMAFEVLVIIWLTVINIRGAKESVLLLAPIFLAFLVTHVLAILWGVIGHIPELPGTVESVAIGVHTGISSIGPLALFLIFIHAYSLGGGTYTGLEAVSNGLPIMREPQVETAKKTMIYMAVSLSLTAAGLLFCYLLWKVAPVEGKTLNAIFLEKSLAQFSWGPAAVIITLIAEGLLLMIGAQAGFIDGPRVLANMAVDSWMPRRFAALSERLTTSNGIFLMGALSLSALLYTDFKVTHLVVMYSINVFLTFSLSIFGMLRNYLKEGPRLHKHWKSGILIFFVGFVLCATILCITTVEKFSEGGWVTFGVTGVLVALCFWIKSHYSEVAKKLIVLKTEILLGENVNETHTSSIPSEGLMNKNDRTAVILVGGYGGLGIHTVKTLFKTFPGVFKNLVFVSVGVIDSGGFKGAAAVDELSAEVQSGLQKFVGYGKSLGIPATYRMALGTDIVDKAFGICEDVAEEFPQATFFTGKIIFEEDKWYTRFLHNETGLALQKRLQIAGYTMVVLPAKIS